MKKIYIVLMIAGIIFPYYFLIDFLINNGFNLQLLVSKLFESSISTFFVVDLLISCIVFLFYLFSELKTILSLKEKILCVISLFLVGLSLALPMMLLFKNEYKKKVGIKYESK